MFPITRVFVLAALVAAGVLVTPEPVRGQHGRVYGGGYYRGYAPSHYGRYAPSHPQWGYVAPAAGYHPGGVYSAGYYPSSAWHGGAVYTPYYHGAYHHVGPAYHPTAGYYGGYIIRH